MGSTQNTENQEFATPQEESVDPSLEFVGGYQQPPIEIQSSTRLPKTEETAETVESSTRLDPQISAIDPTNPTQTSLKKQIMSDQLSNSMNSNHKIQILQLQGQNQDLKIEVQSLNVINEQKDQN